MGDSKPDRALPRAADNRPRIHIWPDPASGMAKWSIGVDGRRYLVRSAGIGVDQALQQLDAAAAGGAIVVIEAGVWRG